MTIEKVIVTALTEHAHKMRSDAEEFKRILNNSQHPYHWVITPALAKAKSDYADELFDILAKISNKTVVITTKGE